MSDDEIITALMRREGWDTFTNDPLDHGGATKWGITQRAWDTYLKRKGLASSPVAGIDEAVARKFYFEEYIARPRFDELKDPLLIEIVVDSGVNHGTARAVSWLQTAAGVSPDGEIGPITLRAAARLNPLVVATTIIAIRMRFYATLVVSEPTQLKFLRGWTNRAMELLDKVAAHLAAE